MGFFESVKQKKDPGFFERVQEKKKLNAQGGFFDQVKGQQSEEDKIILTQFVEKFPGQRERIEQMSQYGMSANEIIKELTKIREASEEGFSLEKKIESATQELGEGLFSDIENLFMEEIVNPISEYAVEPITEGLKRSATGILAGYGPTYEERMQQAQERPNTFQRIAGGVAELGGDLPVMIAGGVVGGAIGGPVLGGAAAFGGAQAVKSAAREYAELKAKNKQLEGMSFGDVMESIGDIAKDTAISGSIGALVAMNPYLAMLKKVPGGQKLLNSVTGKTAVTFATELASLETIPSIQRRGFPSATELAESSIVLTGFRFSQNTAKKILKYARDKKMTPQQAEELVKGMTKDEIKNVEQTKSLKKIENVLSKVKPIKDKSQKALQPMAEKTRSYELELMKRVARQRKTEPLETVDGALTKVKVSGDSSKGELILRPTVKPEGFSKKALKDIPVKEKTTPLDPKQQKLLEKVLSRPDTDPLKIKALTKFFDKIDIERPFKRLGAPETGFQVKNFYSTKQAFQEKTLQWTDGLRKFNAKEQSDLAFLAERKTAPKDVRMLDGYKTARNFFDSFFNELKKEKVLKNKFPANKIEAGKRKLANLEIDLQGATGKRAKAIQAEIKGIKKQLKELEGLEFVSIPARLWFEKIAEMEPETQTRVIQMLTSKQRKTISLKSLVDKGIIKPEDVNIVEIMGHYGRRASRDIALARVLNAAEAEGLVSSTPQKGYIVMPFDKFPTLKRYYAHPLFSDVLSQVVNPNPRYFYDKLSATVKTASFFNPIIMPANDIVQASMFVLGDVVRHPTHARHIPKAMRNAIYSAIYKDSKYWEAYDNGTYSQPYDMPFDNYQRLISRNVHKKGAPQLTEIIGKASPANVFRNVYGTISGTAWGMDRTIRMFSYEYGKMIGLSPREAGQIAALFHGDYARVPPNTRRMLNRFFYTPTFKIVMGTLQKDMIKNSTKYGKLALQGKGKAIPETAKIKLGGLIGLGIVNYAMDTYMNSMGFETVHFGWKYRKRVEDDKGVEKDLTVTLSNPANLGLKFFYRGVDALAAGVENPAADFLRKNQFEMNRVLLIGKRFLENRKFNGEEIFDPFGDDTSTKIKKTARWMAIEALPLFYAFGADDTPTQKKARKKMQEELGKIFQMLPMSFGYLGEPEDIKKARKAQAILNQLIRTQRQRYEREREPLDEKQIENYLEEIDKVLDRERE